MEYNTGDLNITTACVGEFLYSQCLYNLLLLLLLVVVAVVYIGMCSLLWWADMSMRARYVFRYETTFVKLD